MYQKENGEWGLGQVSTSSDCHRYNQVGSTWYAISMISKEDHVVRVNSNLSKSKGITNPRIYLFSST